MQRRRGDFFFLSRREADLSAIEARYGMDRNRGKKKRTRRPQGVVGIGERTQKCIADPSLTPGGDDGGPLVRVIGRPVRCLPRLPFAQHFPGDAAVAANIISEAWASKEDKVLTPVRGTVGWINCRACLDVQRRRRDETVAINPRVICRFCARIAGRADCFNPPREWEDTVLKTAARLVLRRDDHRG